MSRRGRNKRGHAAPPAADEQAGSWIEPAEAPPRLILSAPPAIAPSFLASLDVLLKAAAPAALILDPEALPADDRLTVVTDVVALCHAASTALLLRDDAALAINTGADGAELSEPDGLARARHVLGADRLLGCACKFSRHDAMVAGEAGADYVAMGSLDSHPALDELTTLAAWWSDLFVIPIAIAAPPEPEAIRSIAAAGADFVTLGGTLWERPLDELPGFLAATVDLLSSITRPNS